MTPSACTCRDLVLDCAPDFGAWAPTELQLRYLTKLTRLVLKGHTYHFDTDNYDDGEAR